MKRLLLLVAAMAAVALAVPTVASAATGDIERLEVDNNPTVFDDGDKITVDGDVECRVEDNWGIIMKAFDDNNNNYDGDRNFQAFGEDDADYAKEALGFGGPGSGNQGPVDQPCGEQGQPFDLVLEKLGTSDDFEDGDRIGLWALAAESPTQQADPAFLGDAEVFYNTDTITLEQQN